MYMRKEAFLLKVFELCEHLLLLELNALHDGVNSEQTPDILKSAIFPRSTDAVQDDQRRCEQGS